MANEFIARKGLIALEDSQITGSLNISSTLKIPGFNDVSASLAAAVAGGDNLGNHTATQNLNMGGNAITSVGNVDGVDVSTLNSSFNTLSGKTLVSSSTQIASNISGSWQAQEFISASQVTENVGGGIVSGSAQINSLINDTIAATIVAEIDNDEIPIAKLAEDAVTVTAGTGLSGGGSVTLGGSITINSDGLLSSSAQIASDISGSFTAASSSFSTRVTANDAKLTANTSNVTSAGALMDSELAEIATVKALTAAGISGSWQGQEFISASQVTENVGGGIISGAAQINSLINDTIAATIVAEIDNDEIPIAKLAEDSISGVALGSNLNNLTVDNATLQLNTGTTYNGSAARTISIKDGGVDSDALADDITVAGDLTVAGSIIHDGDTDTKISFPGPDVVSIKAGNTSVFTSSPTGSVLPNVHQNIFDTGSAALTANSAIGDIIKMGNSSTVAGGLYYLKGDGTWALAQANAAGTATGSLAVAVGTNSTTDGMCIRGFVNPFTDPGAGIGSPVYVNDTNPGRMLATAPSSTGDVVRIIGYQYGTDLIYFNPSNDFIIHA